MSRQDLIERITQHLMDLDEKPRMEKLQEDLLKFRDARMAEVIQLDQDDDGVSLKQLLLALTKKNLRIDDMRDSEGYISIDLLKKHNIHVQ